MTFQKEIVLLSKDTALFDEISSLIQTDDDLVSQVTMCRDLVSLSSRLESRTIPFIVVDYDSELNWNLNDIEPISNRFVHTRFILLTSNLSSELVMKAMQSGIRHVQVRQNMSNELLGVMQRLMPEANPEESHSGKVITVLSAGGGCGATTMVVNLANELQLTSSKPVMLVDMDFNYGAVATYLELQGRYGIADVLSHPGNIDANLIDTTSVKYSDQLHALISPVSINFSDSRTIETDQINTALAACKQGHAYTLIDAPRVSMDVATMLAENSDNTLIVFQPMVKDVRVAKSMISSLVDRGIPRERIRPIMNRYKKRREMVSYEEAKTALGDIPIGRMTNDYASAVRGINFGKPLATSAPRSTLRKEFKDLAGEMTETQASSNGRANQTDTIEIQ